MGACNGKAQVPRTEPQAQVPRTEPHAKPAPERSQSSGHSSKTSLPSLGDVNVQVTITKEQAVDLTPEDLESMASSDEVSKETAVEAEPAENSPREVEVAQEAGEVVQETEHNQANEQSGQTVTNLSELKQMIADRDQLENDMSEIQKIKQELQAKLGDFRSKSIDELDKSKVTLERNALAKEKIVVERMRRQSNVRESMSGGEIYHGSKEAADRAKKYFKSFNERYGRNRHHAKPGKLMGEYGMMNSKRENLQKKLDLLNNKHPAVRSIPYQSQKSNVIVPFSGKGLRPVQTQTPVHHPSGKDFDAFKKMKFLRKQSIMQKRRKSQEGQKTPGKHLANSCDSTHINPETGEIKSSKVTALSKEECDRMNRNQTNPTEPLRLSQTNIGSALGVVQGSEVNTLLTLESVPTSPVSPKLKALSSLGNESSETLGNFSEVKHGAGNKSPAFENFQEDKPLQVKIQEVEEEYRDTLERELEIAQLLANELEHKIDRITVDLAAEEANQDRIAVAEDLAADCAKYLRKASENMLKTQDAEQ